MIQTIHYVVSNQFNPYKNLALEEYLLDTVEEGSCILYLWQNERTVVIGKNQNAWKECKVKELEGDGGYLVRRLSGGGAVFHDHGNLNFTFLVHKDDYDVSKQLEVILRACRKLGIQAEKSGRNDITVEGKKFSGNAFYRKGDHCYHHGTILIRVDMENLSKYLNVSKDKLVSKGVESVRSRVTNLVEYDNGLTIEIMKDRLIEAFSEVYNCTAKKLELPASSSDRLDQLEQKFSSWDFKYGRKIEFEHTLSQRFAWGGMDIHLIVNGGIIQACLVYTDAMEVDMVDEIPKVLTNCEYSYEKMVAAVDNLLVSYGYASDMIRDMKEIFKEQV
jgi:lipoate-protein ligase A